MKKLLQLLLVASYLEVCYSDNHLNPHTGEYYLTANESFYRSSSQRGNEVVDKPNASEFMVDKSEDGFRLSDTLSLDAYTSSTSLVAQGTSGAIKNSKFYTQETRLKKKVLDDKFELYGGTVLGASPYELNNIGGIYDSSDRIAAFASGRTGAKYNVSKHLGLLVEGQYNITGQMADDTGMFTGFNGAQYNASRVVKTGFEYSF